MPEKYIQAVRYIRKLRGGSQPILVEGINGALYVVKFRDNPQGPNVLFNEAAGIQLYQACHLPVPAWEPVLFSNGFLERNRACWFEGPEGRIRPESGLCIGIRYLQRSQRNLFEILPVTFYNRIRSRSRFWLAWIVDICFSHTDNRQAIFLERSDGSLDPVFTDSGSLFGGPDGNEQPLPWSSRYIDPCIYPDLTQSQAEACIESLKALNTDYLLRKIRLIPSEWQNHSALAAYQRGLSLIGSRHLPESTLECLLKISGNPSRGDGTAIGGVRRKGSAYALASRGAHNLC